MHPARGNPRSTAYSPELRARATIGKSRFFVLDNTVHTSNSQIVSDFLKKFSVFEVAIKETGRILKYRNSEDGHSSCEGSTLYTLPVIPTSRTVLKF